MIDLITIMAILAYEKRFNISSERYDSLSKAGCNMIMTFGHTYRLILEEHVSKPRIHIRMKASNQQHNQLSKEVGEGQFSQAHLQCR